MLVVLKIPIVYLCFVVWWAIRAEPEDTVGVAVVAGTPVSDTPAPGSSPRRRSTRSRRPSRPHTPGRGSRAALSAPRGTVRP